VLEPKKIKSIFVCKYSLG